MPNVTPIPTVFRAAGETYRADEIQAGIAEAHRRGFDPAQVKLATIYDLRMAAYLFGLLGRDSEEGRRCGEFGLKRLIARMGADEFEVPAQ